MSKQSREMPTRRHATLWLAASALAGCAPLPGGGPPPRIFTLSPKSTYEEVLQRVDWQLVLEPPAAPAGLDTARIAVSRQPLTIEYYAGAIWVDRAPAMVQRLLLESFENSGRIVGVDRDGITVRPDYILRTELREFQAEHRRGNPPIARVHMIIKLVRMPAREIVAAHSVERTATAANGELDSVVAAFDEALGKVLKAVVSWTLSAAPPKVSPGRATSTGTTPAPSIASTRRSR